jgi:LPXTG-site transpeptidase (sortase) family protein
MRSPWVAALLVAAACGARSSTSAGSSSSAARPAPVSTLAVAPVSVAVSNPAPAGAEAGAVLSPLAGLVDDVGSARYDPADHAERAVPVALTIPELEVVDAFVTPVGVQPEGDLDVPGPEVVGWYRFGPTVGEAGATVLAAHVNYNRVPGVFRYLRDLDPGAAVIVSSSDGSSASYVVDDVRLVDKEEITALGVWRRDGPETLVLVTCGGRYDEDRRRYDENVVVLASPAEVG